LNNLYIPQELLEKEARNEEKAIGRTVKDMEDEELLWRPFSQGGFLDVDTDELAGFMDDDEWGLLGDDFEDDDDFIFADDEIWTSS